MAKWIIQFCVAIFVILGATAFGATCPPECQCTEKGENIHVSCLNQGLSKLPKNIPTTVTHLNLNGNNLSRLTKDFQKFSNLQYLDLSFNNLSTLDLTNLKRAVNLQSLNLSNNNISWFQNFRYAEFENFTSLNLSTSANKSIDRTSFSIFPNLETLNLQGNQIAFLDSDTLPFNDKLSNLDLSDNHIRELPEIVFSNLENLINLNLSKNQLTNLDGNIFHINSSLQTLDLSDNNIESIANLSLTSLNFLDLSRNNIKDLSAIEFQQLGNLTVLILNENPIDSITSAVFENLQNLEKLSMSFMPNLSYLSKSTFEGLDSLHELMLSHNPHLSFIHKDLFIPLSSISIIDLSNNAITTIHNQTLHGNTELSSLNLTGNGFICDCELTWLIESIQGNESIVTDGDRLHCTSRYSGNRSAIFEIDTESLHCSDVHILNHTADSAFKIGEPAILQCVAESIPAPEIIWITPRNRVFKYHNFHEFAIMDYLPLKHEALVAASIYEGVSYYEVDETDPNRIRVLEDGSLFINFVMRSDGGPYKCIAKNPKNTTEVVINVTLNYAQLNGIKIWSLVVGFACAGGFFLLNLTYSLTHAAVRRCVSQSRRERIREVLESMDQYKKAHLARIKENYNTQVGKIRDQYHYQLGRLREHHQNQTGRMGRMREGASQRVEKMKDNYNMQLSRLKDYSSSQLEQLREKYNSQVDKIKDFGSDKYDKLHEKYKLKQQHVIKLLDMMNLENCRTVFDTECVRTESMILHSEVFVNDDPALHSPIDSASVSDSEYVTASSSETSKYSSRENMNTQSTDLKTGGSSDIDVPMNPYLPSDDNLADDEENMKELMNLEVPLNSRDEEATTSTGKARRYKRKRHSKKRHSHNTYPNINPEEIEKLYNNFCDEKLDINEVKLDIGDEPKTETENSAQNPGIWYTNVQNGHEQSSERNSSVVNEPNTETKASRDSEATATASAGVTDQSNIGAQHDGAKSEGSHNGANGVEVKPNAHHQHRKTSGKHSRNSKPDQRSNKPEESERTDDVNIEIPDEYFDSWTIKESVV